MQVPGVRYVIDLGLSRENHYDPLTQVIILSVCVPFDLCDTNSPLYVCIYTRIVR